MTDRSIASRPSLEQVSAIVDFMEKHPALALGRLRGLEGRDESKKLWFELTRIVNNINGPTRPMKSWIKFWADKKSSVRSKVAGGDGDPNCLCSNMEKKIWDLFLANDTGSRTQDEGSLKQTTNPTTPPPTAKPRNTAKRESSFVEENFYNEDSMDQNHLESELVTFSTPIADMEERTMAVMEKVLKVMTEQATAMTQLALATSANAQAMDRLADASQIQAQAIDRLANTFETIGAATHDVRNAIVDIDATMKRFYSTSPT